jgi:hypothetical protein
LNKIGWAAGNSPTQKDVIYVVTRDAGILFEALPEELKSCPHWVLWKREDRKGKITKVPLQKNGKYAKSDDPKTWCSFEDAIKALPFKDLGADGIGFMFTRDSFTGIDLDHCYDQFPDNWAFYFLNRLNSYAEISPSGTGIHIIVKGSIPEGRTGAKKHITYKDVAKFPQCTTDKCYTCGDVADDAAIEIYSEGRFFTITGNTQLVDQFGKPITPLPIADCQDELRALYIEQFGNGDGKVQSSNAPVDQAIPLTTANNEVSIVIRNIHSSEDFKAQKLFEGDWKTLGYPSQSEADQAFCNKLAFWCGKDPVLIDLVFRQSKLYRDKWDRADYRTDTINKAVRDCKEVYQRPMYGEDPLDANPDYDPYYVPPADRPMSEEEFNAFKLPDGPKFECKLPKDNFIQRFMGYGHDLSDAYPDYWFASGLFALSVVADKKIVVGLRQMIVYPNLYIAILGKSSLARKSTAVNTVEDLLYKIWPFLRDAVVPTEFSPEAFIEHMDAHPHAPWVRDEAAGVLSLMKKDYMRGFKDSLMQLYDCQPIHRVLRTSQRKNAKTDFKVDDPYLNMLWATTGASFGANTDLIDTLSGFLARFLFFFPQGMKPRWLPLEKGSALNSDLADIVQSQLQSIANRVCDIKDRVDLDISPEANTFWAKWQKEQEDKWTASNDDFNAQIYSRMAPVVIKLAMLFELGSPDFDPQRAIRLEFVQEACRLVETYLMPTSRAVYDIVGSNLEKNVIDRIVQYLKNHNGKSTAKEIKRDIKIKKADFDEYLSTMIDSDVVETKTVSRGGKGRNSTCVFLLDPSNVAYVGKVDKVAKVAIVEEIPSTIT